MQGPHATQPLIPCRQKGGLRLTRDRTAQLICPRCTHEAHRKYHHHADAHQPCSSWWRCPPHACNAAGNVNKAASKQAEIPTSATSPTDAMPRFTERARVPNPSRVVNALRRTPSPVTRTASCMSERPWKVKRCTI